jgi:hypothetical protein
MPDIELVVLLARQRRDQEPVILNASDRQQSGIFTGVKRHEPFS